MDFVKLVEIGMKAIELMGTFRENYAQVRATLASNEQEELDRVLDNIHEENMKLSLDIDAAAADAENRA